MNTKDKHFLTRLLETGMAFPINGTPVDDSLSLAACESAFSAHAAFPPVARPAFYDVLNPTAVADRKARAYEELESWVFPLLGTLAGFVASHVFFSGAWVNPMEVLLASTGFCLGKLIHGLSKMDKETVPVWQKFEGGKLRVDDGKDSYMNTAFMGSHNFTVKDVPFLVSRYFAVMGTHYGRLFSHDGKTCVGLTDHGGEFAKYQYTMDDYNLNVATAVFKKKDLMTSLKEVATSLKVPVSQLDWSVVDIVAGAWPKKSKSLPVERPYVADTRIAETNVHHTQGHTHGFEDNMPAPFEPMVNTNGKMMIPGTGIDTDGRFYNT